MNIPTKLGWPSSFRVEKCKVYDHEQPWMQ
jgi:hypothetical protein